MDPERFAKPHARGREQTHQQDKAGEFRPTALRGGECAADLSEFRVAEIPFALPFREALDRRARVVGA